MDERRLRSLLLGRDRTRTRQGLLAVALVALLPFAYYAVAVFMARQGSWLYPNPLVGAVGFGAMAVVLPAWQAYRNDGALVSVALGAATVGAAALVVTLFRLFSMLPGPLSGLAMGVAVGVPAGALGFVVGAGARRVRLSSESAA
jgi:hypothetical protein